MEAINLKKNLPLIGIAGFFCLLALWAIIFFSKEKKGYVNLQKVYNEFQLKKELDEKLVTFQTRNQQSLDSLLLGLNSLGRKIQYSDSVRDKGVFQQVSLDYQYKREDYMNRQQSFNQQNDALTNNYLNQIWQQINQYTSEFGKENGYELIIGGDGKGTVMYASDGIDITAEVSTYINKRYRGEK